MSYFQGRKYLLRVLERPGPSTVLLNNRNLELHIKPGAPVLPRQRLVHEWYRAELKRLVPSFIAK
jgi:predicted metal-dependent hydrolase